MKLTIKIAGLVLMLIGMKVLAGSIILSGHLIQSLPVIILTICGVWILTYAQQHRKYGWLFIAGGATYTMLSTGKVKFQILP